MNETVLLENLRNVGLLLKRAGYEVHACGGDSICITDPTCIWPILSEFINNAWIVLSVITGFLLAGWAITMLRGAKHDMVKNLRTLVLIFGTLSVALPIVEVLGFDKLTVNKCEQFKLSKQQIAEILKPYGDKLKQEQYEEYDIHDTGIEDDDSEYSSEDEF